MNNDMLRKNGRAKEERGGSAITDRDFNHSNKKAMADTPEAPNPVIGMNDERGAVSGPWNAGDVDGTNGDRWDTLGIHWVIG